MDDPPRIDVLGFDHVVLVVADVERSLAWYCGVLGLAGLRVEEWRAGTVPFPSVRVSATTIIDLVARRAEETPAAGRRGIDHLCLVLAPTDLDALAASGVFGWSRGPIDGLFGAQGHARSLYVRDPDGLTVELRCY
jgi:catechol 2,3-dioxygenase-like lactoylglutathione lyase family enzyme